jgi:hypothetical protein
MDSVKQIKYFHNMFIHFDWQIEKSNPITGLNRPRGYQDVEVPRFQENLAHDGSKVVSPTHRPLLPP